MSSGDSGGERGRGDTRLFALAVAAFLVYAAAFIYRTSFVVEGERYYSLFDDAMVSMRYARNFADGHGLVWNPGGERVEGYTNPLWVVFLSLFHLLPIPQSKVSLVVQAGAAILLALNLVYVRRIALLVSGGLGAIAWGAIVLTALYLPINFWSLQGMEVSVLLLLITYCTWVAMRSLDTGSFQGRLYVLLGIGMLVRPDMVVPFLGFLSFLIVADPPHRRRHAIWGVLGLVAAVALQTIFRLWYYGELLPNTYYLKVTGVPIGVRVARGVYVFMQFVWRANPLLFLLPCVLILRRDRRIWLLFWVLSGQIAYSVYVGGDAWEYWGGSNRYISIAMPGFFILLSYALHLQISAVVLLAQAGKARWPSASSWRASLFAAAIAYASVNLNSIHGLSALAEVALIRPPLHTGPGGGNQRDVSQALLLQRITTPDGTIALVRAGTIPYFSGRPAIDLLGKNDVRVAHGPIAAGSIGYREFRPGHMKFDFAHSIGGLQPDVIVQLRRRTHLAQPFLNGRYQEALVEGNCVHLRRGSPRILWAGLPALPECAEPEPSPDN